MDDLGTDKNLNALPSSFTTQDKNRGRQALSIVRNRVQSGDWIGAGRIFDDYLVKPNLDWAAVLNMAMLLRRYATASRAERNLLDGGANLSVDDIVSVKRKGIQACIQLRMHPEALCRIEQLEAQHGLRMELLPQKAIVLEALNRMTEASQLHVELFLQGAARSFNQLFQVARRSGDLTGIAALLSACADNDMALTQEQAVLIEAITIEVDTGDCHEALALIDHHYSEFTTEALSQFAMPLAIRTGDIGFANKTLNHIMNLLDESLPENEIALMVFVRKYLVLSDDIKALKPVLDHLNLRGDVVDPMLALNRMKTLRELEQTKDARCAAERALEVFPEHLQIWMEYIGLLVRSGDSQGVETAKRHLEALLPAESYHAVLLELGWRCWSIADLEPVVSLAAFRPAGPAQARVFNAIEKLEPMVEDLHQAVAGLNPQAMEIPRLWMDHLLSKCAERRALTHSCQSAEGFASFATESARLKDSFRSSLQAFATELGCSTANTEAAHWMVDRMHDLATTEARFEDPLTHTSESFVDAFRLAEAIIDRIDRKRPTSLLRMNDGEGQFMNHTVPCDRMPKNGDELIQHHWWGRASLTGEKGARVIAEFREAAASCDFMGVVPHWLLIFEAMNGQGRGLTCLGIEKALSASRRIDPAGKVLTSAHFHQDLNAWGLWPEIFGRAHRVCWISCHDLEDAVGQTYNAETRLGITVPPASVFKAKFSKPEPLPGQREPTLFDMHDDIIAQIKPNPGEVWIIAAGFLGKIYCEVVRQRGGIAIDIGSLADYLVGHKTRLYEMDDAAGPEVHSGLFRNGPL